MKFINIIQKVPSLIPLVLKPLEQHLMIYWVLWRVFEILKFNKDVDATYLQIEVTYENTKSET